MIESGWIEEVRSELGEVTRRGGFFGRGTSGTVFGFGEVSPRVRRGRREDVWSELYGRSEEERGEEKKDGTSTTTKGNENTKIGRRN